MLKYPLVYIYTTGIRNRMLLTLIIGKAISLQSNRREEPSSIDGETIE
jgi:hypothetical protein